MGKTTGTRQRSAPRLGPQSVKYVRGDQFIEVTLEFDREGARVVATCPELGTGAFGDDLQEATSALVEAIALQLETLDDAGELDSFLK
jgi:predicted RNase H-like HicB family nuclease